MLQSELLIQVISVLNENRIDYMVTGSIVSSLQGEPRVTHDIDILINLEPASIPALVKAFPQPRYYLPGNSIKEAIERKSMFNILDTEHGDKVDFWILTDEPFDMSRFRRKYDEDVFGFKMKLSRPEDTILAKLKWAKMSGGSEKQFTDSLRVYEVQYGNLDLEYLDTWISRLQVNDLWKRLINEAKPLE